MKKILYLFLFLLLVIGGTWLYFYSQISYVPDWYNSENDGQSVVATPTEYGDTGEAIPQGQSLRRSMETFARELREEPVVELEEGELDNMMIDALRRMYPGEKGQFIKDVHSEITPDAMTIGAILNVAEFPWEDVPEEIKPFRDYLSFFSAGAPDNMLVQFSGKPRIEDGKLKFDENATVQVGKREYPLEMLDVEKRISKIVRIHRLGFESIDLENGKIVFSR